MADDQLLDQIPLGDITGIEIMQVSPEAHKIESTIETAVDFHNAFQIRTKLDGYNSGRSYFLRSEADSDLASLIQGIVFVAEGAARKALARTPLSIARGHARSIYNASWFQGIAAFLIVAVCTTHSQT